MKTELVERVRAGLEAWHRGDVSALEPLLDRDVELRLWEPSDWICHGRKDVVACLQRRARRGVNQAEVELTEVSDQILVAARTELVLERPENGLEPARLVVFRDDKIVSMCQFDSLEAALVAARAARFEAEGGQKREHGV